MGGGLIDANNPLAPDARRPILVSGVDPICGGRLARWVARVEETNARISGPKTDRVNQGCVRSYTRSGPGSRNADICVAQALVGLFALYAGKLSKDTVGLVCALAKWGRSPSATHDSAITIDRGRNGHNPSSFSPHSLREGGATALYRASKGGDLVALFGRWGVAIYPRIHMAKSSNDGWDGRPYDNGGRAIHTATNSPAMAKKLGRVIPLPGRLMAGTLPQGVGGDDY